MYRSPFRYPGGKQRKDLLRSLRSALPTYFSEYREPLAGGGGLFFNLGRSAHCWINDRNGKLIDAYRALRDRPGHLIANCQLLLDKYGTAKECYEACKYRQYPDEATAFFFLQRTSWMGIVHSDPATQPGCSAPDRWWPVLRPGRLEAAAQDLRGCRITAQDFEPVIDAPALYPPGIVFCYLDPPYVRELAVPYRQRLYDTTFTRLDHERLADAARRSDHRILISYDDDEAGMIRSLYRGWEIRPIDVAYDGARGKRRKGRELLISNYCQTDLDIFSLLYPTVGPLRNPAA